MKLKYEQLLSNFAFNSDLRRYIKVAGAVRPRLNVTLEATNKRLLLAAHYGQFRRKMELTNYQALLAQLTTTNATRAGTILDNAESAENSTVGPRLNCA